MSAPPGLRPLVVGSIGPSVYADQMSRLREFACLPAEDPRRRMLREQLILAFVPVVENLARRHANGNTASVEEMTQVGMVGLITAIDRWDPELSRGEFLSYLIPCVRGEMLRWFRDRSWSLRVPRGLKDLGVQIGRVSGALSQELGRAPRPSELAPLLGVGVAEIIEALDARAGYQAGALDDVDPHTGVALVERLGGLDGELARLEERHTLRPLLQTLPERERTVVVLRFFGEMTQTEIAQRLGISQMHVSRLLTRSLQQLRAQHGGSDTDD
jgi:RNA polymerase sigma-B factor